MPHSPGVPNGRLASTVRSVRAMFPGVRKTSSSVRACRSGKFFAIAMSCAKGAWSGADSHFSCISPMTASGRPSEGRT